MARAGVRFGSEAEGPRASEKSQMGLERVGEGAPAPRQDWDCSQPRWGSRWWGWMEEL